MTLYLKYRPQTFEELDIATVRDVLKKSILSTQLPHAFLFCGPKGTGKTSAARILAKAINCEKRGKNVEPCNSCESCISISKGNNVDVIELDAASHRGIDDIRSLREAVKLAPTNMRKKVYIIDEAHMLTSEASNALLKTLEEPPEHVVFILATTNPEKLISTIRSRTTVVQFTKATSEEFARSLGRIAKAEGIKLSSEVLTEIANISDGSFRDGVKILEQLVSQGAEVDIAAIRKLFSGGEFDPVNFLKTLKNKDVRGVLHLIELAVNSGASAKNITNILIQTLRRELILQVTTGKESIGFTAKESLDLTQKLIRSISDISFSTLEQIPLEMVAIEWCENFGEFLDKEESSLESDSGTEIETKKKRSVSLADVKQVKQVEESGASKKKVNNEESERVVIPSQSQISNDVWVNILAAVRQKNASTEALLRAAKPISFEGGLVTIGVYYSFHKERLEANAHRILVEDIFSSFLGTNVRIVCKLAEPPAKEIIKVTSSIPSLNVASGSPLMSNPANVVLTEEKDDDIVSIAEKIFN